MKDFNFKHLKFKYHKTSECKSDFIFYFHSASLKYFKNNTDKNKMLNC